MTQDTVTTEIGKTYEVNHDRKGKFVMYVERVEDEWVHGFIVEGEPKVLSAYHPDSTKGARISVRSSLCTFNAVANLEA